MSMAADDSPKVAQRFGDGAAMIGFSRANLNGYMIASLSWRRAVQLVRTG